MPRLRVLGLSAIAVLLMASVVPAQTPDQRESVVVAVRVNGEQKGDFIVQRAAAADFLVRVTDLKAMGFREPVGETVMIDGEAHLSLAGMRGIAFRMDAKTAVLKIAVPARMLGYQVVDLAMRARPGVERPRNGSLFFNYGAEYRQSDADFRSWNGTVEAGGRTGDLLLVSDGLWSGSDDQETSFVRLMSRLIRDDRGRMQRLTLGDLAARSDLLGKSVILGGVGFERNSSLDPYFVKNPGFDFTGLSALPGEIEISLDGVPLRRESLAPGEFKVENLSSYATGYKEVDVVIRDVFGAVTRLSGDFYYSDTLLKKGVQQYGYYAGFLRDDYGVESDDYGDPVATANHRFGLSNHLTAGLAADAGSGFISAGPTLSFTLGTFGELTAAARYSRKDGEEGYAGAADYRYKRRDFNGYLRLRTMSSDYALLDEEISSTSVQNLYGAGVGYDAHKLGALSLRYAAEHLFDGEDKHTASVQYSRTIAKGLSLNVTLRNVRDGETVNEVFLALTWSGARDRAAVFYEKQESEEGILTVQASRDAPAGEGFGYRAAARTQGDMESLSLNYQYNGPHGIYRTDLFGYDNDGEKAGSLSVFAGGSLTALGGKISFGRPVRDSFGLVEVDHLPGVRVYRNNEEIGRTDGEGQLLLPRLESFYDNEIRLNANDVPMNFTIPEIRKYVSPAYRQGALITFDVRPFRAISGTLTARTSQGAKALAHGEAALSVGDAVVTFPTGKGGEFYLEGIPPATYEAIWKSGGREARCSIVVAPSEEIVLELGEIPCTFR